MENEANGALINRSSVGQSSTSESNAQGRPTYSVPGILHFVQHEWARFEMERAQWEVERAELQARIAFLQGERKGQENLKRDLIRRIKMLEFALRQERQKFHKMKYGTDIKLPDAKDDSADDEAATGVEVLVGKSHNLMFNYRQGRQLLRQYLQEIGYTDKVLDLRSARLHSLLGVSSENAGPAELSEQNGLQVSQGILKSKEIRAMMHNDIDEKSENREELGYKKVPSPPLVSDSKSRVSAAQEPDGSGSASEESSALDGFNFLHADTSSKLLAKAGAEKEIQNFDTSKQSLKLKQDGNLETGSNDVDVLKDFDFLHEESSTDADDMNIQDEWQVDSGKLQQRIKQFKKETKERGKKVKSIKHMNPHALQEMLATFAGDEEIPPPPSGPAPQVPGAVIKSPDTIDDVQDMKCNLDDVALPSSGFASRSVKPHLVNHSGVPNEGVDNSLSLGDLAGLTVTNEASPLAMELPGRDDVRKAWSPKYTLRSHFDCVRSICFHPYEAALVTASEDRTLKLWSLQKHIPGKKGNISDLEPVYTFRGHTAPVLCVVVNSTGSMCFSGGVDATVQCWHLPSLNVDLFGPYESALYGETLVAHSDVVWDLAYHFDTGRLLSCSADGTCCLWNPSPSVKTPLLQTFRYDSDAGKPTSVCFVNADPGQMAATYTNSECLLFDLETAKPIVNLVKETSYSGSFSAINKVVSHPTINMLITAHEDRYIRFFDPLCGKEVHNMVAHLDAVTSLSVDPSGLYILSGSHDGSIRLWNMENKTCIQEITAHRKKCDEAVFDVAFHPSQPYIASAGADALAKIFA